MSSMLHLQQTIALNKKKIMDKNPKKVYNTNTINTNQYTNTTRILAAATYVYCEI